MNTKNSLLAITIHSILFTTVAFAGDVEVSLPSAADAFTVDQPAGTELMRVHGNGNVGIGTVTPGSPLHINRGLANGTTPKLNAESHVIITNNAGESVLKLESEDSSIVFGTNVAGDTEDLSFVARGGASGTGVDVMTLAEDGNVGIGTTNPVGKLDVRDTKGRLGVYNGATVVSRDSNNVLTVRNTSEGGGNLSQIVMERGNGSGDGMSLSTRYDGANGVDALSVTSQGNVLVNVLREGNVGIGTVAPSDGTANGGQALKLDVEGAVGATHYCDEVGENCVTATELSSGGGAANAACEDISARASGASSSVVTGVWSALPVAGKDFDTEGAFDTGTGTYTIPRAGKYHITVRVNGGDFLTHPTFLGARLTLNGQVIASDYQTSDNSLVYPLVEINTLRELNANDVLAINGYHNDGVTKNMTVLEFAVSYVNADCGNGSSGGSSSDNLGNHKATQNIDLVTNKLVGNGGTKGVSVAADGNVGIGTATPTSQLDVVGATNAYITLRDGDATKDENVHHAGMRLKDGNDNQTAFIGFNTSVEGLSIQNLNDDGSINFSTGGNNNQMVIAADGNVGIGTAGPTSKLELIGAGSSGNGLVKASDPADADEVILDPNFGITHSRANAYVNNAQLGGNLSLRVSNTAVRDTVALTALGNGNIGIGTSAPTHPLQMGSGAHVTSAGVWTNASDVSKKENIKEINYGLETVMKLKPSEYDYKTDNSHSIGFIAQEIEKIVPEVVSGEDGNKGVAYGSLTAVLVKAMQQQQAQIEAQQQRIEALEAKLK